MSTSHILRAHAQEIEIDWTKIKGGCQSGRNVVPYDSKSNLPLSNLSMRAIINYLNFVFAASGLMIASRYPIMEAKFHVCRHKRYSTWQQPICYGVIMAKVDLGHKKVSGDEFFNLNAYNT